MGTKVKVKKVSEAKIKQKAYSEFQKWCRLSRADQDGYVMLLDNGHKVKRNEQGKVNGGHYFGKKNRPQLAFEPDNCHPISCYMNERQAENEGTLWKNGLIMSIGAKRFDELQELADSKFHKFMELRDRTYYMNMYECYREKNEILLQKLNDALSD